GGNVVDGVLNEIALVRHHLQAEAVRQLVHQRLLAERETAASTTAHAAAAHAGAPAAVLLDLGFAAPGFLGADFAATFADLFVLVLAVHGGPDALASLDDVGVALLRRFQQHALARAETRFGAGEAGDRLALFRHLFDLRDLRQRHAPLL